LKTTRNFYFWPYTILKVENQKIFTAPNGDENEKKNKHKSIVKSIHSYRSPQNLTFEIQLTIMNNFKNKNTAI